VAGSISFFFFGSSKRQIWPLRVAGSLPLAVGVDAATPSGRIYLFFFFLLEKSSEVGGGSFIWLVDLLIVCFDFILNLCIFLKMLRCQLMSGGQKTPPFCHDHMATALKQDILIHHKYQNLKNLYKKYIFSAFNFPPRQKFNKPQTLASFEFDEQVLNFLWWDTNYYALFFSFLFW
jgi:hypothetical protein